MVPFFTLLILVKVVYFFRERDRKKNELNLMQQFEFKNLQNGIVVSFNEYVVSLTCLSSIQLTKTIQLEQTTRILHSSTNTELSLYTISPFRLDKAKLKTRKPDQLDLASQGTRLRARA